MKKIMKLTPILLVLVLFIAITPASAIKHVDTHIVGLIGNDVQQGDNFTENIHVRIDGLILEEHGIFLRPNSVYLKIYDSNGLEVDNYTISHPSPYGNKVTIHTSNLQPGKYTMTAYFTGKHRIFREYDPCNESDILWVRP